jgi:hypothetical protein
MDEFEIYVTLDFTLQAFQGGQVLPQQTEFQVGHAVASGSCVVQLLLRQLIKQQLFQAKYEYVMRLCQAAYNISQSAVNTEAV